MSRQVYIDSTRQAISEALAIYIYKSLGYKCFFDNECRELNTRPSKKENTNLYLLDCAGIGEAELWARIRGESIPEKGEDYFALFSVAANINSNIEIEAFIRGYRGLFLENIGLDLFTKGIREIFEGQFWFSRNVLNHVHEWLKENMYAQNRNGIDLTSREKEVLALIAAGNQNADIAEKLCISLHTVKSHIYNLFKKIKVPNRFQAALWATNNGFRRAS